MGIFLLFSSYQKRGGNRVRHEPENEKEEKKERKTFSCLTGFWKGKIQFGAFFWPCELNSPGFTKGGKEREGCRNKKKCLFRNVQSDVLCLRQRETTSFFGFVLRCMRVVLGFIVPVYCQMHFGCTHLKPRQHNDLLKWELSIPTLVALKNAFFGLFQLFIACNGRVGKCPVLYLQYIRRKFLKKLLSCFFLFPFWYLSSSMNYHFGRVILTECPKRNLGQQVTPHSFSHTKFE